MNALGSDLLRLLSSQATPGVAPGPVAAPGQPGAIDFAKLLDQAKTGHLSSGREVTIGKGAPVQLSDDQLKRISAAADLAEAQGATRALVMIDGQALKVDVAMREVTGAVDLAAQGVLTGIDAVVQVPSAAGSTAAPTAVTSGIANPTLLSLLANQRRS